MSLPSYIINWGELALELDKLLDENIYRSLRDVKGKQRIKGFAETIPALEGVYKIVEKTWETDILITAVTFLQSGWKGEDYWSLWVDDDRIFDEIYTKEIGEQKHWELFHTIKRGQTVKLLLHNISGNSRNCWVDLEWIEVDETVTTNQHWCEDVGLHTD